MAKEEKEKKPEKKKEAKEEKASHKAAEKAKEEKAGHKAEKEEKTEKPEKAEKPEKEEKPSHKAADEKPVEKEGVKEKHDEKQHSEGEKMRKPRKEKPKRGKDSGKVNFVELKPGEIVEAIVHLANEGHSQSEIGMILRDQYGIPKVSKAMGKKIGAILEENKLLAKIPEDLMDLIRKSVSLRGHMEKNRKDMSAKRGLMLTVSKIRALEKYYKTTGKLPLNWRYTPETAALLAK